MRSSITIGANNKRGLIVHNHPSNGSFSRADLLSTASLKNARGVVATHDNGYRKFEKMSHLKIDTFAKAVVKAKARGKYSSDTTDKWLKRNQKKYGYRLTHYQD